MKLTSALLLFCGLSAATALSADEFRSNMANFFMARSGESALSFMSKDIEEILPFARGIARNLEKPLPKSKLNLVCNTCITLLDSAVDAILGGAPIENVIDAAVDICLNLHILDADECYGVVSNYAPELFYMVNQGRVTGDQACAILLGKDCGAWESVNNWSLNIDPNKPAVVEPTLPDPGSATSKVLHLTDFHLDLTYTLDAQGGDCGSMMCCNNDTAKANTTESAAGYWGDYNCDLPLWTLTDMLQQIKANHEGGFDYIMLTGDFPAHDVWRQGREANLAYTQAAVEQILAVFPNTPVYPSLGNHESFPCNSFPSSDVTEPEFENSWLYQGLGSLYSQWLPQSALDTFTVDGYYSLLVRPGFRFITINSIYCYTFNFWLNWDTSDPVDQLQWLHDELLAAEAAGELVHILSHVPSGKGDCLGGWGREYTRIINRFENTVVAQFMGHTHNDEYTVYYEEGTSRATNIAFISPSITTWSTLNPSYRLYTLDGPYDGASMRVLDHETYITDIISANAAGSGVQPEYFKLYSAKDDLGMANLFPQEWDALARRMAADDELYQQFFTYFASGGVDHATKRSVICSLVTSCNLDDTMCIEIMGEE